MKFDPGPAARRISKFWSLGAEFGMEHNAFHVYLDEIVSDRYVLVNGLQLIHDELQLAGIDKDTDVVACGADFALPSVVTTLAHTNCGDRIHQGEATTTYHQIVAARFATMSEIGESKLESFSPPGGGTDDGATLAHVTVAHQIDDPLRRAVYYGNEQSYVLVNIDLMTHVGRLEQGEKMLIGRTQESKWRQPRAACGALVGTLTAFDPQNRVHQRVRSDLGEENYEVLAKEGIFTKEGVDARFAVAAAIVAIRGMENTAKALAKELDERGVGHLTASMTVNRPARDDTILYLGRSTVFDGKMHRQGLGTNARDYRVDLVEHHGDERIVLRYQGFAAGKFPIESTEYAIRHWKDGAAGH